jgi:NAD(P)-dependent dehydrogenase (short-subunit alcohol dehydrogenase family)
MRLEDKRVLITGTAGGQGEAAQAMFAREGARIIGCDVQEGAAEKTADALRADGHDVTGFTVDLADAEAAARWVDESAERHLGATGNSSIINTASMSGLRGIAPLGQAAHSAAKGGVIALTRTLAAEGAPDGIRANTISPGFVKSPATDKFVGGRATRLPDGHAPHPTPRAGRGHRAPRRLPRLRRVGVGDGAELLHRRWCHCGVPLIKLR